VISRFVQRAPRFVGDAGAMQLPSAPHWEWIGEHRETPCVLATLCVWNCHGRIHGREPVWLMSALARAPPSEQISAVVSRRILTAMSAKGSRKDAAGGRPQ